MSEATTATDVTKAVEELRERVAKLEKKNGKLTMVLFSGEFDKSPWARK
jgi:hypothetical protein